MRRWGQGMKLKHLGFWIEGAGPRGKGSSRDRYQVHGAAVSAPKRQRCGAVAFRCSLFARGTGGGHIGDKNDFPAFLKKSSMP